MFPPPQYLSFYSPLIPFPSHFSFFFCLYVFSDQINNFGISAKHKSIYLRTVINLLSDRCYCLLVVFFALNKEFFFLFISAIMGDLWNEG
jgi:hypothetical protein